MPMFSKDKRWNPHTRPPARVLFVRSLRTTRRRRSARPQPSVRPKSPSSAMPVRTETLGVSPSLSVRACLAQEAEIDPLFPPVPPSVRALPCAGSRDRPPVSSRPCLPTRLSPRCFQSWPGIRPGLFITPLVLIFYPDLVSIWYIYNFWNSILLELSTKSGV
jgi:hypothetical protein